jgi:hypothetical protein
LALAAVACSHDFDALYEGTGGDGAEGRADSGTSEPGEGLPWLPALPDLDRRSECERCARSMCEDARAECLKDDDCIDELSCKAECDDPACLQRCNALHEWSSWYGDYAECVFGQCRSECNVGNNWGCRDNYDWPDAPADASSFEVEFRFTDHPTLGSEPMGTPLRTSVRACRDELLCSELDYGTIGVDHSVRLQLIADDGSHRDFRGYLELDEVRGGELYERFYPTPLARAQAYYAAPARTAVDAPMIDLEQARVRAIVFDCLVAPVAGARVTLPDSGSSEITALTLEDQGWVPGATSATGIALLMNLPESATEAMQVVRAVHDDSGAPIGERAIWLRPELETAVMLGPSTISD